MERRTKIIATIGPASEEPDILAGMMEAGMNVARIGLAHNDLETSVKRFLRVRNVAKELGKNVGILVDLPGPKIRTAPFKGTEGKDGCDFSWGEKVQIKSGTSQSTRNVIEVDYEDLAENLAVGDQIGFGDGSVLVSVEAVEGEVLDCRILHGGTLVGRPGVRIPAERVNIATPTPEDMKKLDAFLAEGTDLVALSFVRSAEDMHRLNLKPYPEGPLSIAKIETNMAVKNLREIVQASGAVMVARGDLGINYPLEELPTLQKQIILECITCGRPVITATQMLESMINAPTPTRAEVSDIANAVFDGTSAVMLSAETAVGADPVRVVETMARVAQNADENFDTKAWAKVIEELGMEALPEEQNRITHAVSMAAARVAKEMDLKAVICISGSGKTVRSIARFRPDVPILGFSTNPKVIAQLTLSWGVAPFLSNEEGSYEDRVDDAMKIALQQGVVKKGDLVAILAGLKPDSRSTDVLRLFEIP